MTFLAVLLITLNGIACTYLFIERCKINSAFQFFYLSLLSLVILPGLFDLSEGMRLFHPYAPPIYLSPYVVATSHVKIFFIMLCFLVFERVAGVMVKAGNVEFPDKLLKYNIYDVIFVVCVLTLIISGYAFGFSQMASMGFDDLRVGSARSVPLVMMYLQIIIVGLPGFYIFRFGRPAFGIAVFLFFIFVYIFLGGSRQIVIFAAAIMFALTMIKIGRSRYILLILIFTLGFSSMDFVLQMIKFLRNLPSMGDRVGFIVSLINGDVAWSSLTVDQLGSESNVRYVMYGFLHGEVPSDFGQISYLRRTLLFWLPSALDFANIKPDDFEIVMFSEAMGGRYGTMHATFFGSAYADAQEYAFVWVAWFVVLFRAIDFWSGRLPVLERSMVWGSSIYVSFMVARGSFYAPMVVMTAVLIASEMSRRLRGKRMDDSAMTKTI
jgi:hypothetical protein